MAAGPAPRHDLRISPGPIPIPGSSKSTGNPGFFEDTSDRTALQHEDQPEFEIHHARKNHAAFAATTAEYAQDY
jgi:hypothetical protein